MKFNSRIASESKKVNTFVAGEEAKGTLEGLRLVYNTVNKPNESPKKTHYLELKLNVGGVKTTQNVFFSVPEKDRTDKFGKAEVLINENFGVYWSFERALNKLSQSVFGKDFYDYIVDESIEIDLPGDTLEEVNRMPASKVYGKFVEDSKVGLIGKEVSWFCAPKVQFKEELDGSRAILSVSQFPVICYTKSEYEEYMTRLNLTESEKATVEKKIPGVWGK